RPRLLERMRRAAAGVAELHTTHTLDDLERVARTIAARGTDLVALSGGDGSFMAGATALARAYGGVDREDIADRLPALALLPGGTVATVARQWGMKGDAADLFDAILANRNGLGMETRPSLRVEDDGKRRIGFIFGTGLVANFFELYYAD